MAEGEPSRRWEVERQSVKRAEAKLSRGLRNLEEARLAYLTSLTKEQRRLQQELLRLQKSRSKQKFSVSPGRMSRNLGLPLLCPQGRHDYSGSHTAALRRKPLPSAEGPSGAIQAPSYVGTLNSDVTGCEGDRRGLLPPLKGKEQNADSDVAILKHSIAKQLSISTASEEQEDAHRVVGDQGKESTEREAGAAGITPRPATLLGKARLSLSQERPILDAEAYAVDGHLRTMYTRPDFLQAYTAARKARYLRHTRIPAWEKELSLQEIFGHKKAMGHSPQGQAAMKAKAEGLLV